MLTSYKSTKFSPSKVSHYDYGMRVHVKEHCYYFLLNETMVCLIKVMWLEVVHVQLCIHNHNGIGFLGHP